MYRGLLSYAGKWGLIFFWIFGCGCQPIFIFFGDSLSFWGNQNMILQSHLIIRNGYLASEQPGSSEPFSMPNLSVYFINSKQPGVSEQFCDDQKSSLSPNSTVYHNSLSFICEN